MRFLQKKKHALDFQRRVKNEHYRVHVACEVVDKNTILHSSKSLQYLSKESLIKLPTVFNFFSKQIKIFRFALLNPAIIYPLRPFVITIELLKTFIMEEEFLKLFLGGLEETCSS